MLTLKSMYKAPLRGITELPSRWQYCSRPPSGQVRNQGYPLMTRQNGCGSQFMAMTVWHYAQQTGNPPFSRKFIGILEGLKIDPQGKPLPTGNFTDILECLNLGLSGIPLRLETSKLLRKPD